MEREIAVFCGAGGETVPLGDPGKLTVFRRCQGTWLIAREMEFFLAAPQGLQDLRRKMGEMLVFLGECKIFVASEVSGVPYFELEKAGFTVWEYPGDPSECLELICAQEEEKVALTPQLEQQEVLGPSEQTEGYFSISLHEIQSQNAGVSSKQALLPFIRKGEFQVLEIHCGHIPCWLQQELLVGGFTAETEEIGSNDIVVTIRKN